MIDLNLLIMSWLLIPEMVEIILVKEVEVMEEIIREEVMVFVAAQTSQAKIISQICGRSNRSAKNCWNLQKYAANCSESITNGVGGVTLFKPTENS